MSKKKPVNSIPGYEFVQQSGHIEEYKLKANGLRVLYYHRPDTGVVTTNITYLVGARDEARGETGLAHMLEHMLFKPTKADIKNKIKSGSAMKFERDTGCLLNANTWKDRTTYYFSYPTKYFSDALKIEAERMTGVILNEKELTPEKGNVLSEFDMYNGDPYFALGVDMVTTAFQSHPYGHETIGFRPDIEDYTPEKLDKFYQQYYRPDNAVMMVIGDIDRNKALTEVKKQFKDVKKPKESLDRIVAREPKQEGLRRVEINRPSTTNLLAIGLKHQGFPTRDWFVTGMMLDVLTEGDDSILHKALVDTGKVSSITTIQEPTSEPNLGIIYLSLAQGQAHRDIEDQLISIIDNLKLTDITSLTKKIKAQAVTSELLSRQHSLNIAQELTEYVSAGDWSVYNTTIDTIKSIKPNEIIQSLKASFTSNNLTIGCFNGVTQYES